MRTPRKGVAEKLVAAEAEIAQLKAANKKLQRQRDGAVGRQQNEVEAAEERRVKSANYSRQMQDRARRQGVAEGQECSGATQAVARKLSSQMRRAAVLATQLIASQEALQAAKLEGAVQHGELAEKMQEQFDVITSLHAAAEEAEATEAELRGELLAMEKEPDARTTDYKSKCEALKDATGIRAHSYAVPPRQGSDSLSTRHMAAVLQGRGEGDDINLVANALARCGYLEPLAQAPAFQPVARAIAAAAVARVQEHWSPHHAVHVWDRLELSRSQCEALRHLLSFVYDPVVDKFVPIRAWQNPHRPSDYVLSAKLASRQAREGEYHQIAAGMDVVVGVNGRCERDVVKCASLFYTNYAAALRKEYSEHRPAQPVLFLDGTGGALGRGICHAELGSADFDAPDTKQSRATLQPLALFEGTDHLQDQRDNLPLVFASYNRLAALGCIDRADDTTIPCRPLTAADMQGAKSTYGMTESSHSVWCKCQRGGGGPHHAYPDREMATYDEMLKYIESEVGCEIKTFEELCSWAHFSPGVAKGGKFTPFKCSCCDYAPSEKEWRAEVAAWHLLSSEEQAVLTAEHLDRDDELNSKHQHYHQLLFSPPLPHHGMERCGVDNLHLVYLNLFKHLFKYTVHDGLPDSKKKLMRAYTKSAGFYSYDAASDSEDPCKHWIGREVKRFVAEAHLHLPFMLQLAAAPIDTVPELAATRNLAGEEVMDYDPEYAPTEEQVEEEELLEPLMLQNAQAWDNFLNLVRELQRPWPQGATDTDDYRKARAVSYFNCMAPVCSDLLRLKPTLLSWVPHIALFVVPRQMVYLGDPMRRACDACESWGAMAKKIIKHLTCRRRVDKGPTQHELKSGKGKVWQQHFTKGFIHQAFERTCVRESLQHGPENAAFAQRADARRLAKGKASDSRKAYKGEKLPMATIYELAGQLE